MAYTAAFAVCAGCVFWGCWSATVSPVMPDCASHFPAHWAHDALRQFLSDGKFAPWDLTKLLGAPWWFVELNYCAGMYCSGLALAYFLLGRRLRPLAAYGAALLLAFCGYWCTLFSAGHLGWFQYMTYGLFAFGLIDRALARGGLVHWLFLGAVLGWGSYYQSDLWLLFTVLEAAYFLFALVSSARCASEPKVFVRTAAKGACAALVAFALVGLPGFYGAFAGALASRDRQVAEATAAMDGKAGKTDDGEARWRFMTNWSLPPEDTLEFLVPRIHGDTSCQLVNAIGTRHASGVRPYTGRLGSPDDRHGNYRQHSLYVGFVTCLLALCGLVGAVCRRENRTVIAFFAAAALVCWLFSLGRYCAPVYRLVYALPFGDYLRAPVKWHHLTEFALVALAGFGTDFLLSRFGFRWARLAFAAVILIGVADLVRVDRLYCAPVDYSEAKRQNLQMSLTALDRRAFADPRVQQMVQSRRIQSVARLSSDVFLVGVLQPYPKPEPLPPFSLPTALGIIAALASLGVVAMGLRHGISRLH